MKLGKAQLISAALCLAVIGVEMSTANSAPLSPETQIEQSLVRGKTRGAHTFSIYTNERVRISTVSILVRKVFNIEKIKCWKKKKDITCKWMVNTSVGFASSFSRKVKVKPYLAIEKRSKLENVSEN